jgi:hypothetical protein
MPAIFAFKSNCPSHVRIAFDRGLWAVNQKSNFPKVKKGDVGFFQYTESAHTNQPAIALPFEILESPTPGAVNGIWPGTWKDPFAIRPLTAALEVPMVEACRVIYPLNVWTTNKPNRWRTHFFARRSFQRLDFVKSANTNRILWNPNDFLTLVNLIATKGRKV